MGIIPNICIGFSDVIVTSQKQKSCSNRLSVRQQQSGLNIFPATLNNLSTGADEAGKAGYLHAS